MKRLFDFIFSLTALALLLPVLLMVGVWVWADSPGGALYWQERVGKGGRLFWLVKFRSMSVHRPGPFVTLGHADPRITRAGKFLRRTKMDELPQLWNVLVGDMSLVGPRPEVPHYVALYTEEMREVLSVRPGLTDPASLEGFDEATALSAVADPETHYREVIMPEKVAMQRAYIAKANLWSDVGLIARTFFRIFKA